jgi:hypothetical protein
MSLCGFVTETKSLGLLKGDRVSDEGLVMIVGNEWWEVQRFELNFEGGAAVPLNESEVVDRSRTFEVRRCRSKLKNSTGWN